MVQSWLQQYLPSMCSFSPVTLRPLSLSSGDLCFPTPEAGWTVVIALAKQCGRTVAT